MTYLCVPIFVRDLSQARADIWAAVEASAEMIELRIDTLDDPPAALVLAGDLKSAGIPWIVTCRALAEGGHSTLSDSDRLEIVKQFSASGAPFVDVELASLGHAKIGGQARRIVSFHDFSGRPDRLGNLLLELNNTGCEVRKIVWRARTVRDNLEAFEILRNSAKPTIALCMGEAGVISRVLAKKFGAFLTFASLSDDSATAPGQVSIAQMRNLYRWDKIRSRTRVYGVVAHPVGHSMSPAVHNAAFEAAGHDGVYVPFLVNPGYESFKAFMETFVPFEGLDLCGLSVTLPHKENALRYLQEKEAEVEKLAARIGAVNTIVIESGRLSGLNTDYAAILHSITTALGCTTSDLRGMPIGVLGAGGTGRTAVAALAHWGARVVIYNRTPSKAAALAHEFGVSAEPWENLSASQCRVYVNTTSVGMHPNVAESPFGDATPKLTSHSLVFDTIYNPMQTKLLRDAKAAGARTIGGVEMFVQQAAGQFAAWTKQAAPAEVMRRAIMNYEL